MINSIQLSDKSLNLLNLRQLNQDEIQQFSAILTEAKSQQGSAKNTLLNMSPSELALVQKANSLADSINVTSLSEEGATNLLRQPDNSDKVDLNNDGIVEVGAAKSLIFPPVNAPASVKTAWESATANLSEEDKMMLELRMHLAVFGANIEGGNNKQALSPDQQWSQKGIENLFKDLQSNLEFRVNMEGWTEHNLMLKGFYERFHSALNQSSSVPGVTAQSTTSEPAQAQGNQGEQTDSAVKQSNQTHADMMQLLLDARMGIDREKLEEIEEKIKTIENDASLSSTQKQTLIYALQKQKEVIFEEAQRRTVENEKRKSLLSNNVNLLENLAEQKLKEVS